MFFFWMFVVVVSSYSWLTLLLLVTNLYLKYSLGVAGWNERINHVLTGTKMALAIQVYSYVAIVCWVLLALPWLDLFTFRMFMSFMTGNESGISTYFGNFVGKNADHYFLIIFFNVLGMKASMNVAEIAGMLKRGRVRIIQIPGHFGITKWQPE